MLGKIKNIEEVTGLISAFRLMDGYKLETDKHIFHILIENQQNCCESWGYFASEDDLNQYIGATLKEIKLTDVALNQRKVEKKWLLRGWRRNSIHRFHNRPRGFSIGRL